MFINKIIICLLNTATAEGHLQAHILHKINYNCILNRYYTTETSIRT